MKRILTLLLTLLLLVPAAHAQETTIYLPLVLNEDNCYMTTPAILEITDGTTTVNLIAGEKETGFHLSSWRPQIIQPKDGGVYQDSSIAPGRDLVFGVDGTANEVFNVKLNGDDQDRLIRTAQDLLRLLTKARNYSITSWQDTPVYIKAKSSCETNTRYALIKNFTINDVDNPYSQPFFTTNALVAMNNIAIAVERGHWLGTAPGVGECAEISSSQEWTYADTWAIATNAPTNEVFDMIRISTGRILATDRTQIWYSDDNGINWNTTGAIGANDLPSVIQLSSGRILAGDLGQILYSDDNGDSWGVLTTDPGGFVQDIIQTTSGRIIAGESGQAWYSDNNGASWALLTTLPSSYVFALLQTTTGKIIMVDGHNLWFSNDNGNNWNLLITLGDNIQALYQASSGQIFAGEWTKIWISNNDGVTWGIASASPISYVTKFLELSSGEILASDSGQIWYSNDGYLWKVFSTYPTSRPNSLLQIPNGDLFAGEDGQIDRNYKSIANMGTDDTCLNTPYIANKQNVANLTDIYIDDGGVFSANLFSMTLPTTLLPAVPVVNDAIYFGINTAIGDSGPFTSLVFDISTPASSTTSYTITWEYYTGAAWAALTVKDGTNSGIGALSNIGVNSVHWTPPSNWAANAVNGVTAFWVRARVSALVGTLTPPVQQNRNIYSVVNGYIEIASTEVLGDIPALSQILAHNRSDLDGPGGNAPNLYENRLLVGLRSYDRGPTFQAYLNAADEQNPFGLMVSVGANTTIGADIYSPTGRSATYNPAGVEAIATRVTFTFGPTIARDYYGTYHAFLRAYRDGGASTDFTVRLQVTNGSGGVTYTTDTAQLATTTRFEVLDFGLIKIPVAGSLGFDELGDTSTITVQASAANAAINLVVYDLILIPTDEFCVDSVDKTNSTLSEVGKSGGFDKVLNIDSVTMPKFPIRSVVQRYGSNLITSIYNPIAAGEAIFQANVQQRLWFFSLQTSATGLVYSWISPPEISHSIQLYKNERYLALRGDR